MIDPQLESRIVLITGAHHGIGAATARAFASQGAQVFIAYYRGTCRYSEKELAQARQAGVGGDRLYQSVRGNDNGIWLTYTADGSRWATWQRSGRVGRGGDAAIALVAQPDALDQYLVTHPRVFLERQL